MAVMVRPVGYRVLVKRLALNTGSRIEVIGEGDNVFRFVVLALGDARVLSSGERVAIPVAVGDEILFEMSRAIRLVPRWFFGPDELALVDADGITGVHTGEVDRAGAPELVLP